MKIRSLTLRNFKRFVSEQTIEFRTTDGNDITLLIGPNGSGKSTILQAIAAIIGSVSRPKMRVDQLNWEGFNYDFLQTGRLPTKATIEVSLNKLEIEKTREFANELRKLGKQLTQLPDELDTVSLVLDYDRKSVKSSIGPGNYFQMSGYQFALQLKEYRSDYLKIFDDVGSIYWYAEQRSTFSLRNLDTSIMVKNIDTLRELLVRLSYFNTSRKQKRATLREGQRDSYETLSELYSKVFPNRFLVGAEPNRNDLHKSDFWLRHGDLQYEISELSAGERAIFPILLDFSLMNINNSIVIIDELELHLHPQLLGNLISVLRSYGKNNQFIISTHSPYLIREISNEDILLVKDGRVEKLNVATHGRDVAALMEELFDLRPRPEGSVALINSFYSALNDDKMEEASQLLGRMVTQWGQLDEEVVRATMYYESQLQG
jgi:predicted ATPase